MKFTKLFLGAFFIIIAFSSCDKEITNESLNDNKWVLSEIEQNSISIKPIEEVYIEFEDTVISGKGGCNSYQISSFIIEGNKFEIEQMYFTEKYCGEKISSYEDLYFKVLKSAESIYINGDGLTIDGQLGKLKYKN